MLGSNHGSKTGNAQALSVAVDASTDLGKKAQIVAVVTMAQYLDPFKHLFRLKILNSIQDFIHACDNCAKQQRCTMRHHQQS